MGHCVNCGTTFRDPDVDFVDDMRDSDCDGCHRCMDCALPDCPVCGNHCRICKVASADTKWGKDRNLCSGCFGAEHAEGRA